MGTDVAGTVLPWVEAIAQSFEPYSFESFHRSELPTLVAQHGHLVVEDLRGASPLAFRTERSLTFTWSPTPQGIEVAEGDAGAATLVELAEPTFSEFLHQLLTASGAVRTGRAQLTPGAGRRALYFKFAEPKTFDWIPADCHYNDALFRADPEGRVASRATTWEDPKPY